jgi:hypothetical protein
MLLTSSDEYPVIKYKTRDIYNISNKTYHLGIYALENILNNLKKNFGGNS